MHSQTSQDISAPVFLPRPDAIPQFLDVLVAILPKALKPALECQVMLHGASQRVHEACNAVFTYCLERSSQSSIRARVSCLSNIVETTSSAQLLSRRIFCLLYRRLLSKEDDWAGLDDVLKPRFSETLPTRDELGQIIALIRSSNLNDSKIVTMHSYIHIFRELNAFCRLL